MKTNFSSTGCVAEAVDVDGEEAVVWFAEFLATAEADVEREVEDCNVERSFALEALDAVFGWVFWLLDETLSTSVDAFTVVVLVPVGGRLRVFRFGKPIEHW